MLTMTNREVIADLYRAFIEEDPAPVLAAFNENSVWTESGNTARSGVFRGVAEIALHALHCKKLTDGTMGTEVQEILVGERFVVVVERALALRNGTSLNMLCNTVYEMADGVIAQVQVLPYDPEAWNEFWS